MENVIIRVHFGPIVLRMSGCEHPSGERIRLALTVRKAPECGWRKGPPRPSGTPGYGSTNEGSVRCDSVKWRIPGYGSADGERVYCGLTVRMAPEYGVNDGNKARCVPVVWKTLGYDFALSSSVGNGRIQLRRRKTRLVGPVVRNAHEYAIR